MLRFQNLSVQAECIGVFNGGPLLFRSCQLWGPVLSNHAANMCTSQRDEQRSKRVKPSGRAVTAQACVVAVPNDTSSLKHFPQLTGAKQLRGAAMQTISSRRWGGGGGGRRVLQELRHHQQVATTECL